MGKKAKRAELISVKVLHEQRWAYERRLEHLSYHEIRVLSANMPEHGGLGYDVSEHRLKGLVAGYRERMAEVEAEELGEHRARELHDLDMIQREAGRAIDATRANPPVDAQGNLITFNDKAVARYLEVGRERRKLLGLDQPVKAEIEVTTRDAVTEELNAMLARAGRPPIEVEN